MEERLETLDWRVAGGIGVLTLNRPDALNALNAVMFGELERVFRGVGDDPAVHVILLTGAGERAFAAGADIRDLVRTDAASGKALSERGQEIFRQIEQCGVPVIACVNGAALGGGCELAMACSFRIASESARFGMPELKLGLIPGYGGTQRLVDICGRGAALRLLLMGEIIAAGEAWRLGLVQEVVPAAELLEHALRIAKTIASMAPLAVSALLQATQPSVSANEDGYRKESEIFGQLCGTRDKQEGLSAFLDKRPPHWSGS